MSRAINIVIIIALSNTWLQGQDQLKFFTELEIYVPLQVSSVFSSFNLEQVSPQLIESTRTSFQPSASTVGFKLGIIFSESLYTEVTYNSPLEISIQGSVLRTNPRFESFFHEKYKYSIVGFRTGLNQKLGDRIELRLGLGYCQPILTANKTIQDEFLQDRYIRESNYTWDTKYGWDIGSKLSFSFIPNISFSLGFNYMNLYFTPRSLELTSYTVNGEETVQDLSKRERITEFEDEYINDHNPNKPRKRPKFTIPFKVLSISASIIYVL